MFWRKKKDEAAAKGYREVVVGERLLPKTNEEEYSSKIERLQKRVYALEHPFKFRIGQKVVVLDRSGKPRCKGRVVKRSLEFTFYGNYYTVFCKKDRCTISRVSECELTKRTKHGQESKI